VRGKVEKREFVWPRFVLSGIYVKEKVGLGLWQRHDGRKKKKLVRLGGRKFLSWGERFGNLGGEKKKEEAEGRGGG